MATVQELRTVHASYADLARALHTLSLEAEWGGDDLVREGRVASDERFLARELALRVIGPERLPALAAEAELLAVRLRAFAAAVGEARVEVPA